MSGISAAMVKELREKSGAGIMDCKNALGECDGDLEKAIDFLRKKGIATAAKRAGRATSEGTVQAYIHMGGKIGVVVDDHQSAALPDPFCQGRVHLRAERLLSFVG